MRPTLPLPTTLGDLLLATARRDPDATALIALDGTARWSWADLARHTTALARRLRVENRPGTVVAVWAASEPAWVVLELACALAGLVVQPIDPEASDAVVTEALERSGARWIAVGDDDRGRQARVTTLAGGRPVRPLAALVGERLSGYECGPLPGVAPSDPLLILPTSGTTGAPKAVVLSHAAVTADATLVAARMGLRAGDRWLTLMPLHRSGGCSTTVAACVAVGATMLFSPRWAPDTVIPLLAQHEVTVLSAFPRALQALVASDGAPAAGGPLRLVQTGGAPVAPALVRALRDRLGARLSVVYGLSEAAPVLTQTDQGDEDDDAAASVGRPLPGTEVVIADPQSGTALPTGALGEVRARGPQLMTGYLGDGGATATAIDAEGWLHTGDLGWLDAAGRLHVEGRLGDVLERDGERWLPSDVEAVLMSCDGVAEAVVVGIDPRGAGDHQVVAFVRLGADGDGGAPSETELRAAVAAVWGERRPVDRYVFLAELPALPSGKVRRGELRALAARLAPATAAGPEILRPAA